MPDQCVRLKSDREVIVAAWPGGRWGGYLVVVRIVREYATRWSTLPARVKTRLGEMMAEDKRLEILTLWSSGVAELRPSDLILPMFVREGIEAPVPISSMPGVVQHTLDSAVATARDAATAGIGGLMLFGVPVKKDPQGSQALEPDGILNRAIEVVAAEAGEELLVMSDLCLDEFTDHGHCGVLADDGSVDNDATIEIYAKMALLHARAGAFMLGLSGMMDGQVARVRRALDENGYFDTRLLAYSAKYASNIYAPFRDAVNSSLVGDRKAYQLDPPNAREGVREAMIDVQEGADVVMVKPALPYLDLIARIAQKVECPIAAYQVSGEYSMIEAGAADGVFRRHDAIFETLWSIKRAGAAAILTYWAIEVANLLTTSS